MAMTRRGFLSAILGTSAAVALFPDLLSKPADFLIEVPEQAWDSIYLKAHHRAFQFFQTAMQARGVVISGLPYPSERNLGDRLPSGRVIETQHGLSCHRPDLQDDSAIDFAMRTLAQMCQIDDFAQPSCRCPGTIYAGVVGPLRMVVAYDVQGDREWLRFDVLGAESEALKRLRELERREALKVTIRRRLLMYPHQRPSLPA